MKRCCVSGTWRTLFSRSLHRLPKASSRCGCTQATCMFHERSRADGHIDASALHAPQRLTNSDEVDVFYDDGWWLMTFMGTRRSASGTEYHVRSDLYQVERWVPADHIRPHWRRWGAKWRQLDQMRKQPAQAKASPKKVAPPNTAPSPSPKAAAPNASGPAAAPAAAPAKAAAAAAPAKAAPAAAPAKANPLGKITSTSSEVLGARNGARPAKAGSGSAPPPTPWPMAGTTQWQMTGTAGERPDVPVGRCLACMHVLTTARARSRLPTGELCGQMLRQMQAREEAAWFEHPVSLVDVPDYLALISHPMDYSTMGKKLAEGEYSASLRSFASDMRLIFRNALTYNWNAENQYHRAAKQVCSPQRAHSLPKPEHASAHHSASTLSQSRSMQVLTTTRDASLLSARAPVLFRLSSPACAPPMTTLRTDAAHNDAPRLCSHVVTRMF